MDLSNKNYPLPFVAKQTLRICIPVLMIAFLATPVSTIADTVYEDAEDGLSSRWLVYDDNPSVGASITNILGANIQNDSRVIETSSTAGKANGYRLITETSYNWHNNTEDILQWKMRFDEDFTIYVAVETDNIPSTQYLVYTNTDSPVCANDLAFKCFALGETASNGLWQSFTRDLGTDLTDIGDPSATLVVNGFYVRGSGQFDDIALLSAWPLDKDSDVDGLIDSDEASVGAIVGQPDTDNDGWLDGEDVDPDNEMSPTNSTIPSVYEDADLDSGLAGWWVYDDTPEGYAIDNVLLAPAGRAIQFTGTGTQNGFRLGGELESSSWRNRSQFLLQWSHLINENFIIYADVNTDLGRRFMEYTPNDNPPSINGSILRYGLGSSAISSNWQTFTVNLEKDISRLLPGINIREVNAFLIRGSGLIDDISLMSTNGPDIDSDGLSDLSELYTYLTDPTNPDTDGDGWMDGVEIELGYDPLVPTSTVQEYMGPDTCNNWSIYDSSPDGANITCNDLDGITTLTSTGTSNGFRLLTDGVIEWQNHYQFIAKWEIESFANFVVYLDVETSAGQRYMTYNPASDPQTSSDLRYVHVELDPQTVLASGINTISRDLQADLTAAEPGNAILEVNGAYIRGDGIMHKFSLEL